jgi:hypothetical protein
VLSLHDKHSTEGVVTSLFLMDITMLKNNNLSTSDIRSNKIIYLRSSVLMKFLSELKELKFFRFWKQTLTKLIHI